MIVEVLARTSIRRGELLALTVDAVVAVTMSWPYEVGDDRRDLFEGAAPNVAGRFAQRRHRQPLHQLRQHDSGLDPNNQRHRVLGQRARYKRAGDHAASARRDMQVVRYDYYLQVSVGIEPGNDIAGRDHRFDARFAAFTSAAYESISNAGTVRSV